MPLSPMDVLTRDLQRHIYAQQQQAQQRPGVDPQFVRDLQTYTALDMIDRWETSNRRR